MKEIFKAYKYRWRPIVVEDTMGQFTDRFFPSSKLCSDCGEKKVDLTLTDREWLCEGCEVIHDRDFNASLNIKREGLRILKNNNKTGCGMQPVYKQKLRGGVFDRKVCEPRSFYFRSNPHTRYLRWEA